MATSQNAQIDFEMGRTMVDFQTMTDSGDQQIFTLPSQKVWSGYEEQSPDIRPNGVVSGRNLISTHASNDTVNIAAFTAYSASTLYSVSADTAVITRPGSDVAKVNSIIMDDTGAIDVVAGTDGATTTFSETRGAAGGPPLIGLDEVELGQIRVTTAAAGVIAEEEIYQVDGQHHERYDFPVWSENNIGDGDNAEASAQKYAHIKFASALPSIHTGNVPKRVYARVYIPIFAEIGKCLDFVPAESTHSVNSTQYYNGTDASVSTTLGQSSFTVRANNGITDGIVSRKNKTITTRFYQDRNKTPYILTQGKLGIARAFPVADQVQVSATTSSEVPSADFTS